MPARGERTGSSAGRGARGQAGRPDWRRLLAGASPREVLARIVQGDPLGLRAVVARRLRERALFCDADAVQLRALARCARYAGRYTGRPALAEWLSTHVDAALDDLLEEGDRATAAASDGHGAFVDLAAPLGLSPERMRAGCATFNRLAHDDREAFFRLVIEMHSLDECATVEGVSGSEYARRARRALDVLSKPESHLEGGSL